MSTKIVLQPVLPLLTVEKVDADNIEQIRDFLRAHVDLFPALKPAPRDKSALVYDVFVIEPNAKMIAETIAETIALGDYLVTSENGNRHLTKERAIRHGVVTMLPKEMFAPIEATILPDEKPFV